MAYDTSLSDVSVMPDASVEEKPADGGGMKSWPPRAPADIPGTYQLILTFCTFIYEKTWYFCHSLSGYRKEPIRLFELDAIEIT